MNSKITLAIKLSKFNLELSKAEALLCLKAYFETELISCVDDFCFFKVQRNPKLILKALSRLAFAKEAFIISENCDLANLEKLAHLFNLPIGLNSSFKIHLPFPPKQSKLDLINKVASNVLDSSFSGKISLSNPDLVICYFEALDFLGLLIWSNKDVFRTRRAHLKPAPHPSGIDPRLARAMINLASAKNEVLDPFCGAGGILEEVRLLGLKYIGVDISWKMINLARINLKSKDNLFCQDALSWNTVVECIVTDLPYGKNSKLDGSLILLINGFFEHFKNLTKKIVVCTPHKFDVEGISKKYGWKLTHHFDIFIHGSLTRRIHVLEIQI